MPVDIVVLLLSPRDAGTDHLKALARVSRALRDREFLAKLRGAGSPDAIYALTSTHHARDAAYAFRQVAGAPRNAAQLLTLSSLSSLNAAASPSSALRRVGKDC